MEIPEPFRELKKPHRWKVFYGGRASGKSWSFARMLLRIADSAKLRILCAREFQSSIKDSVHLLLCDQIAALGLSRRFEITRDEIVNVATGAQFIFKGLRRNINEIKSTEGVDICWVEEAQSVSRESWDILSPTIRKAGSEIWVSFNPNYKDDATYKMFVESQPPDSFVRKINYSENPWLSAETLKEIEACKQRDFDAYSHIWEGETVLHSNLVVFANKFSIESFETPITAKFFHGVDWGFSNDPTAAIRCFEQDGNLYIDQEVGGVGIEFEDIPRIFDAGVPTLRSWPSYADNARPETISFMRRKGFVKMNPCQKWSGCVRDRIEYIRGAYSRVIIHERCKNTAQEFRLYSYESDGNGNPLPIVIDKNNHYIDAIGYALDPKIKPKKKGALSV